MISFADNGKIWSCEKHDDKDGKWWVINQDTYYPRDRYSKEEAEADYSSPESIMARADATYRAWCD
jgi:hypothetical protein